MSDLTLELTIGRNEQRRFIDDDLLLRPSVFHKQPLSQCTFNFATETDSFVAKPIRYVATPQEKPDSVIYNVTVDLKKRVGRSVRINIEYLGKWLLISEITFESGIHY